MTESGDYISREETLQRLCEDVCNVSDCQCDEIRCPEWHVIYDIPAADVRPALRGKWIDHQEGRWIYAKCSECGTVHDVKSNFCPNCGADMREES